jgi:hypothetical protein
LAAKITQKPRHQRACAGAIHIIIAEYRDMFATAHRNRNAVRRRFHISQARWVWHQRAELRFQEIRRIIQPNAARGQQAPEHLRQFKPLRDAKPNPRIARAPLPAAACDAARDTQYGTCQRAIIHEIRAP